MLLFANIGCIIALVVFAVTCIYSYCYRTTLARLLGRGILASMIVLLLYLVNINVPNTIVKTWCVCMEYVAGGWVVFFMSDYATEMCGVKIKTSIKNVLLAILMIDSAILASAPINEFAGKILISDFNGILVGTFSMKPLFGIHLAILIGMYIFQGVVIGIAIRKTSVYYNIRYIILAIAFIIIGLPNLIYMFLSVHHFDGSRWLYAIGTAIVFYDTFMFSPQLLLRKLHNYVDDIVADAMVIYDSDGKLLQANKAAEKLLGKDVLSNQEKLETYLGDFNGSTSLVKEIGTGIYNIIYSDLQDKKGSHVAVTVVFHDITESEKRLEREHFAAITDPLTKSYNRLGFFEAAREFMKTKSSDSSYVVVISGICNFKGINSLYGLKAGDEVLKTIAVRFHELHHKYNFVYGRTAEGKFASLVPLMYVEEIVSALSRINIDLGDGIEIRAELKHGFVKVTDEVKSFDYYYELAILALAKAKENSISSALEYSEEMEDDQHKQQMLLAEMRIAIDEGEFFIELQPQINLSNKKITGAEALVRWNHPALGRIPPNEFIPLFENNGYITFLDHFVWEEAAKTIRRFMDEGIYNGSISVNVSRMDIINTDVPLVFDMLARKYDIPPSKLHIEITESACVDSPDILIEAMTELRAKGFLVEIDDFGSGYSSLNALMKLPFDIVKLDMAFMKQTNFDDKSEIVISSVARMIHNLRASIIVEGVETEKNVQYSEYFGADVAQGYFYSKPVSKDRFIELVKEYNDKKNPVV